MFPITFLQFYGQLLKYKLFLNTCFNRIRNHSQIVLYKRVNLRGRVIQNYNYFYKPFEQLSQTSKQKKIPKMSYSDDNEDERFQNICEPYEKLHKENTHLKSAKQHLEKEKEKLSYQLTVAKENLFKLQDQLKQKQKDIRSLTLNVTELNKKLLDTVDEKYQLKQVNLASEQKLSQKLKNTLAENEKLIGINQNLVKNNKWLEQSLHQLQKKLESHALLQQQLAQLRQVFQDMQKHCQQLERGIQILDQKMKVLQQEKVNMAEKIKQKEKKEAESEEKFKKLLEQHKEKTQQYETELRERTEIIGEKQFMIGQISCKHSQLFQENKELKAQIEEKIKSIQNLERLNLQKETKIQQLSSQNDYILQIQQHLSEAVKEKQQLSEKLKQFRQIKQENLDLLNKNAQIFAEMDMKKFSLNQFQQVQKQRREEISRLEEELEARHKQLVKVKKDTTKQIQTFKKQIQNLKASVSQRQDSIHQKQKQNACIRNQLQFYIKNDDLMQKRFIKLEEATVKMEMSNKDNAQKFMQEKLARKSKEKEIMQMKEKLQQIKKANTELESQLKNKDIQIKQIQQIRQQADKQEGSQTFKKDLQAARRDIGQLLKKCQLKDVEIKESIVFAEQMASQLLKKQNEVKQLKQKLKKSEQRETNLIKQSKTLQAEYDTIVIKLKQQISNLKKGKEPVNSSKDSKLKHIELSSIKPLHFDWKSQVLNSIEIAIVQFQKSLQEFDEQTKNNIRMDEIYLLKDQLLLMLDPLINSKNLQNKKSPPKKEINSLEMI